MSLFSVSGADLQGIRALGAGAPPDGNYPAIIEKVEGHPSRPGSFALHVRFQSGFTSMAWLNMAAPLQPGQTVDMLSKDEKRKRNGKLAALRSVLESLGYDATTIDNPANRIDENWLVYDAQRNPRQCYVEWVDGVGDEYGEIQAFLTRADYEGRIAAGHTPKARAKPAANAGGQTGGWAPGSTPGMAPTPSTAGQPPVQQGQGGWTPQGQQQAPVQQGQGGWNGAPQQQPPVQQAPVQQGQGGWNGAPQQPQGGGWGGSFPPAPTAPR